MAKNKLKGQPIYIYAPEYVTWSAGIRVLYKLCDLLNNSGFQAWIALHGPKNSTKPHHSLNAPILNSAIAKQHHLEGKQTIGIYPETVHGNPLNT